MLAEAQLPYNAMESWTIPDTPPTPSDSPQAYGASDDPLPMNRKTAYRSVAAKVGWTPFQAKEVVEAMMEVAAQQLNSVGTFNMAGAISLIKKKKRKRVKNNNKVNEARCHLLKKFMIQIESNAHVADAE